MPHSHHSPRVKVVLGTAFFGDAVDPQVKFNTPEESKKVLDIYRSRGYTEVDTARGYPVGAPGSSERLLSTANDGNWMTLDTKVVSWTPGSHEKENIRTSIQDSLEALKASKVRSTLDALPTSINRLPIPFYNG